MVVHLLKSPSIPVHGLLDAMLAGLILEPFEPTLIQIALTLFEIVEHPTGSVDATVLLELAPAQYDVVINLPHTEVIFRLGDEVRFRLAVVVVIPIHG
jgi:hypothetical protein